MFFNGNCPMNVNCFVSLCVHLSRKNVWRNCSVWTFLNYVVRQLNLNDPHLMRKTYLSVCCWNVSPLNVSLRADGQ